MASTSYKYIIVLTLIAVLTLASYAEEKTPVNEGHDLDAESTIGLGYGLYGGYGGVRGGVGYGALPSTGHPWYGGYDKGYVVPISTGGGYGEYGGYGYAHPGYNGGYYGGYRGYPYYGKYY